MSPELVGQAWRLLGLGLAICLMASARGFKRVEYFISLGYAASIPAQAVVLPLRYRQTIRGWALVQSALRLAYGLRLASFPLFRAATASFQNKQNINAASGAKAGGLPCPIKAHGLSRFRPCPRPLTED